MHGHADWRSAIAIICGVTVVLGVIAWMRKSSSSAEKKDKSQDSCKKETDVASQTNNCQNSINKKVVDNEARKDVIAELPKPKWKKVGQIQELYFYPLKSGRGKSITECNFTNYGISVRDEGKLTLRDRMFLVYNEETYKFQTGRHYPTMILVSLSAVDEFKVKMEAVGMPSVIFSLPSDSKKRTEAIECKMWWGEPTKCIDCGAEAAEWLSRFLTGTNSGVRLAYTLMDKRSIQADCWKKYAEVYKTIRDEDMGLFSDLSSYMLMTTQSLNALNEKLESPVPAIQFRPNILVDTEKPFAEDDWEWIKIGERAVIRNVKPCTRCKMIKINHNTGVPDKDEPLKTLQSFRELTDPERVALEGNSPQMGIYCGLYVTGTVKVGDDVFLHVPEDSSEQNHTKAAKKSQPT